MGLPPKDADNFSPEEWAIYAKDLLRQVMPQEERLVRRVSIVVTDDQESCAQAETFSKKIFISRRRILLFEKEEEFMVILAHELGHIKFRHCSVLPPMPTPYGAWLWLFLWLGWRLEQFRVRSFKKTFGEFLIERELAQELEADEFATRSLPVSINAAQILADTLEKLGGILKIWPDLLCPAAKMHRTRIERLRRLARNSI